LRIAHFLSQISHESSELKKTKENLRYSKKRFLELYKNTKTPNGVNFDDEKTYSHLIQNDNAFANWRYGYRNKQGILVNHRGRGYIHITWKANYQNYTNYYKNKHNDITIDFVETPELLEEMPYSLESSFFYWSHANINSLADKGAEKSNIIDVSKKVNGGLNGIDDRMKRFKLIFNFLIGKNV